MTLHVHYVFIDDSSVLCPVKFGHVLFEIFAFEFLSFFIPVYFTYKKSRTQFIEIVNGTRGTVEFLHVSGRRRRT